MKEASASVVTSYGLEIVTYNYAEISPKHPFLVLCVGTVHSLPFSSLRNHKRHTKPAGHTADTEFYI